MREKIFFETLNIGNKLEPLWDEFLIDSSKTTTATKRYSPVRANTVMVCDKPWESGGFSFFTVFYDDGIYRAYYMSRLSDGTHKDVRICYAQSNDGITFFKPELGICEFDENYNNNIIMDYEMFKDYFCGFDGAVHVFRDDNPACPACEKYKAIVPFINWDENLCTIKEKTSLYCYFSSDAVHFTHGRQIINDGFLDSLNTMIFDSADNTYKCYYRDYHIHEKENDLLLKRTRDIKCINSKDCKSWSEPELIHYEDGYDYNMYTNNIMPYYRAPHIKIGLPTRYFQRNTWIKNYDFLPDVSGRQAIIQKHEPRSGLALTDCVFMMSRDGKKFLRTNEAFLRPGPEKETNWRYGDAYLAYGITEIKSADGGFDNIMSFYSPERLIDNGKELVRYTLRKDGFFSREFPFEGAVLTTKPIIFEGSKMFINFSTSAFGNLFISIIDEDENKIKSIEFFGDSTDREVIFEDGILSNFAKKPVIIKIEGKDAEVYSLKFS